MRQEPWTYVIVHAASKMENLLFFLYIRNTFRPFFLKKLNEFYLLNTWHEHEWRFLLIFLDFIYVSLFQSKGQNSLSDSNKYSSYKLINYSCSNSKKKSVTKYEN